MLQLRKTKGICKFSARFLAFSNKISTVQKWCCPRAEDRAIFEDLRLRGHGQGQGLQNASSRTSSKPRTSSRTQPLVIEGTNITYFCMFVSCEYWKILLRQIKHFHKYCRFCLCRGYDRKRV